MARKAIVDRSIVLELLKEGKTSQSIADRFGVSRQAIDLYRKQFAIEGLLTSTRVSPAVAESRPDRIRSESKAPYTVKASPPPPPSSALSLDQMVDLVIQAFTALKRVPELESELAQLKKSYEMAQSQIIEMQSREQKRKEQETRWFQAQNSGVLTYRPPTAPPPP